MRWPLIQPLSGESRAQAAPPTRKEMVRRLHQAGMEAALEGQVGATH